MASRSKLRPLHSEGPDEMLDHLDLQQSKLELGRFLGVVLSLARGLSLRRTLQLKHCSNIG